MCATARRRWRCTCCGGCSVGTPPSRARLFVALDLPADAREALVEWRAPGLGVDGLRLVDPAGLHVTLAFLGHLDEAEIPRRPARDAGLPRAPRRSRDP